MILDNRAFHVVQLTGIPCYLCCSQPTWPPVARCEYLGWCDLPNSATKGCAKNMRHRNSQHYWRNSIGCANNSQAYTIWVNTVLQLPSQPHIAQVNYLLMHLDMLMFKKNIKFWYDLNNKTRMYETYVTVFTHILYACELFAHPILFLQ